MEEKIDSNSLLITAITDRGEEKNLIIENEGWHKTRKIIKHEGFVSVVISNISAVEIDKLHGVQRTKATEVDLNKIWLYEPIELDYFSRHEDH